MKNPKNVRFKVDENMKFTENLKVRLLLTQESACCKKNKRLSFASFIMNPL